jgi:ATP-dependent helicase/nuclease subunit B
VTISFEVEPFGPKAAEALGRLITEFQGEDPLARVTVVVPGGPVGLATRRLLASGRLPTNRSNGAGIANVAFVTLSRLAEQIGGPMMAAAGRRPATDAVVHAAARRVLVRQVGPLFARVAEHPATLSALVATYRDLRNVPTEALSTLAVLSSRAAEVVQMVMAIRESLTGWYDDADLAHAAVGAINDDPTSALCEIGPVVLYLPLTLDAGHLSMVRALAGHEPVAVLLGSSGDALGDQPSEELARQLGWQGTWPISPGAAFAGRVVSAPSADAEVLVAVRDLMSRASSGTPLERMALVHGGQAPYPRLIRETLTQSDIPLNGRGVRTLASTAAGRILLGLFTCMDHDWRRDDVMAWLASTPLHSHGHLVPASAWDEVSVLAGVTSGLAGWRTHLTGLAEAESERLRLLDEDGEQKPGTRRYIEGTIRHAEALHAFIEEWAERLSQTFNSWTEWSTWSRRLLVDLVGGTNKASEWPAEEAAAFTAVDELLAGLAVLDGVDPSSSLVAFRSVVASELDVLAPQTSRFGRGVMVGQVDELAGLDFDVIYIVGMTDGAFPGRVSDDALLPDRERSVNGAIPLRGSKVADRRRNYLAALSSAPECVISFARGDQRGGREQRPSRWLLDALAESIGDGKRLYSSDLDKLPPNSSFDAVPSFVGAVGGGAEAISITDRDTRSLLQWNRGGRRLSDHFLARDDEVLALGLQAHHARRSPSLTRFDGLIDGVAVPSPASGAVQSPTGLESYAACPRRYLFERLMRIDRRERPEEIMTISPAERGILMHTILERFIGEQTAKPLAERIAPSIPWNDSDLAHLVDLAEEEFVSYEQRGLTGRPLFWSRERTRVLNDLRRFLIDDSHHRAATRSVPHAVEFRFGTEDRRPVAIALEGGREVRFRGSADRIDRMQVIESEGLDHTDTPSSYLVIDYKTGGLYGMDELDVDPVARGTKLQLPVYAAAAEQQFDAPVTSSSYWFISEKGKYERIDYRPGPEGSERLSQVLSVLVDGIEAGQFPARPNRADGDRGGNCNYCPYDEICPTDRQHAWERKRQTVVLSAYRQLAEGDDDDELGGVANGH